MASRAIPCIIVSAWLLTGCGAIGKSHPQAAFARLGTPIPVHDVVLADSYLPGYGGSRVELVDVSGTFLNNEVIGPFQGKNWTGKFQLREIGAFGRTTAVLNLPSQQYTLFMHKFRFTFVDYNGNTYPDFALGQYAGSDNNQYQIFSVEPDGIKELPISTYVVLGPPNAGYSPRFAKVGPNAFTSTMYNNTDAEWVKEMFTWSDGEFVESSRGATAIAAAPACSATQLSAANSGNQGGGTQIQANVRITDIGAYSCILAGVPTALNLLRGGSVLATRMLATPSNLVLHAQILSPHAANAAYLVVWWGNWCGARSEPVELRIVLPAGGGTLRTSFNNYGGHAFVPECLQPGAPSTLQVTAAYLSQR